MPDRRAALHDFIDFANRRFDASQYEIVESIESVVAEWRVDYERRRCDEVDNTPFEDLLTPEEFEERLIAHSPALRSVVEERRREQAAAADDPVGAPA